MNVMEFGALMAQKGCVGNGKSFCGSFNGYPFVTNFLNGTAKFTSVNVRIQFDKIIPNKMYKELRKMFKKQLNIVNSGNQYILCYQLSVKSPDDFSATFDNALNAVASIAPSYGVYIPNICPYCKQSNCDSYVYENNTYHAAHAACVQNAFEHEQVKAQKNLESGSYLLGILGAILGGIVGSIPNILLYFVNIVSGWACFLVPLGAYQGYKILNGKRTKAVGPIVAITSILMLPVTTYFQLLFDYLITEKKFVTPLEYIDSIAYNFTNSPDVLIEIWAFSFIFTIIGIAVTYNSIKRTSVDDVRDKAYAIATLRPIGTFANPGYMDTIPYASMPAAPEPVIAAPSQPEIAPNVNPVQPEVPNQSNTLQ